MDRKIFNVICFQKWKIFTFLEIAVKNGKYCKICKFLELSDFTIFRPLFFLQILPLENIVSLPCWLEVFNCKYMESYVYNIQVVKWLTCCVKSGTMVILG